MSYNSLKVEEKKYICNTFLGTASIERNQVGCQMGRQKVTVWKFKDGTTFNTHLNNLCLIIYFNIRKGVPLTFISPRKFVDEKAITVCYSPSLSLTFFAIAHLLTVSLDSIFVY